MATHFEMHITKKCKVFFYAKQGVSPMAENSLWSHLMAHLMPKCQSTFMLLLAMMYLGQYSFFVS